MLTNIYTQFLHYMCTSNFAVNLQSITHTLTHPHTCLTSLIHTFTFIAELHTISTQSATHHAQPLISSLYSTICICTWLNLNSYVRRTKRIAQTKKPSFLFTICICSFLVPIHTHGLLFHLY